MKELFFIGVIFIFVTAKGEEMDQFSDRLFMVQKLVEQENRSHEVLDRRMNVLLQEVLRRLNKKPASENQRNQMLVDVFQHWYPGFRNLITPYANWIVVNSPIAVFYPSHKKGIYGVDVDYDDMLMAWYVKLAPIISINGILQATDKVGHFIGQGWSYFMHYKKTKSENSEWNDKKLFKSVQEFGYLTEQRELGLGTGGVFSYADLVSNWQGFLFFLNIFKSLEGKNYFKKSKDGNYKLVRQFKWSDHITDEWDEVINPSRVSTKRFFSKIQKNFHGRPGGASGGPSICQQFLLNPKRFLNKSGKILSSKTLLFITGAPGPFSIDVEKICKP